MLIKILLGFVTGRTRTFILAFGETLLADDELTRLDALLARRVQGEPVAYLTGQREFWSLPLEVSAATLIPRPDTECLVEQALARLAPRRAVFSTLAPAPARLHWRSPASGPTVR
ncbi:Methylase of polypeptide chain release factors [Cronobacter dublinensis 582]|nr:Methylase of polypeptide chain release factors [Cronobacter dublinensis 582]